MKTTQGHWAEQGDVTTLDCTPRDTRYHAAGDTADLPFTCAPAKRQAPSTKRKADTSGLLAGVVGLLAFALIAGGVIGAVAWVVTR